MGKPRPVPACLRDLPLCPKRKLPVPFAAARYPDGTGEFTIIDPQRVALCARHRLCGVCGDALGRWVAFLGGEASADPARGAYSDPGMHPACCEAALGLCVFIARPRVPRRTVPINVVDVSTPAGFADDDDRVKTWVMVIARDYQVVGTRTREGGTALLFRPLLRERTRTFGYGPDGKLREVRPPVVVRAQRRRPRKRR